MALSQEAAEELAELLPDGLSCTDARERLLCVVEVLRTLSDAEHPLSNADIRAVLKARFGPDCAPSENTIAADLRAIAASGCLGLELHTTPVGSWCERSQLTPAKVRLLLNAVQSSRFLTVAQSNELQEDLFDLVSRHQEEDLSGQVHVEQRVRRDYQQVFDTIDAVAQALRKNRKVEFVYTFSGFDGRPHPLAGDDGETLRCETPIALYYMDGNYYVETYSPTPWRHSTSLMLSRADRMLGTRVSDKPADGGRTVYDARRSARRRVQEGFDMVPGALRTVFLRVRSDMTNVVFDRFGFGLKFGQFTGHVGDTTTFGTTVVRVPQVMTFYRWLSAAGDRIVLEEPPNELELRTGPWSKAVRGMSREELLRDYEEMVAAYLAFLDKARSPYVND